VTTPAAGSGGDAPSLSDPAWCEMLNNPAVTQIQAKDGISVFRVESGQARYVLKVFGRPEDRREISNYTLLTALGVPVLPVVHHTESALLLPDVEVSAEYRLGVEADMSDPQVARAVARWYRTLHGAGCRATLDGLYDETDVITWVNMDVVAEKTGTKGNRLWPALRERFPDVRRRIDALSRTLTYNDFHWTNLIVARDGSATMMLDLNLLGKGYAYADVRNVTSSLAGEAKQSFLDEYGDDNVSADEVAADAVLSPLVALSMACKRDRFPAWAEPSLEDLNSGRLLDRLMAWDGVHV